MRVRPAQRAPTGPSTTTPALLAVRVGNRGLFDHEPLCPQAHLKRRMIEVKHAPVLETRRHRLEQAPVQPHGMTASAQR
jgi:hypothetical protein